MAMKYTEEQLNHVNKSILVQLFLACRKRIKNREKSWRKSMADYFFNEAEAVHDLAVSEADDIATASRKKATGKK